MAQTQAKVIIKGENQIGSAVNSAKSDLTGFESVAQRCGETLKNAFTATAVIAGLKAISAGLKECTKSAIEDQKYMTQLSAALGGSADAIDKVTKKFDELEKITIGEGDSLKALATELASMGRSTDEINSMLEATASLATATGVSIDTAYNALNSTLQGTGTRLEKLGIDLSNVTKQELENGKAIQLTIDKYSQLAKSIADNKVANILENIDTSFSHIKENLGYALLDAITPALETIYGWLLAIEGWTQKVRNKADENKKFREDQDIISTVVKAYDSGDTTAKKKLMELDEAGLREVLEQFAFKDTNYTEAVIDDYQDLVNYVNKLLEKGLYNTTSSALLTSADDGDQQDLDEFFAYIKKKSDETVEVVEENLSNPDVAFSKYFHSNGKLLNFDNYNDNILTKGIDAVLEPLGVFGEILTGANLQLAILKPVIEGFTQTIAPMLEEVIVPLSGYLEKIGSVLAQTIAPILDAIAPIISAISNILDGVLMPIIIALSKVFTILMAPVQYLADLFSWLGEWIKYLGSVIGNLFNKSKWETKPSGFSSDAFSGLSARLSAIGMDSFENIDESVSSGGNVASYSGATTVHINIYMNAPVVGSGGIEEFAAMIRNEFDRLDYYGVTA